MHTNVQLIYDECRRDVEQDLNNDCLEFIFCVHVYV